MISLGRTHEVSERDRSKNLARLVYHFQIAEGSQIQRECIAPAMLAIEAELVQKQRDMLSAEFQVIFMMTYECFVMWGMKQGLASVLKPAEVESIIAGIHRHFAKHGYYRPKVFEKIWDQMQLVMPMAMTLTPEGVVYPVAEMLMAPALAGYPLDPMIGSDLDFGVFVGIMLGDLGRIARIVAENMSNPSILLPGQGPVKSRNEQVFKTIGSQQEANSHGSTSSTPGIQSQGGYGVLISIGLLVFLLSMFIWRF